MEEYPTSSKPIDAGDVETAAVTAMAELDASLFQVRFDCLTPAKKHCLRGMTSLGGQTHERDADAQLLDHAGHAVRPRAW